MSTPRLLPLLPLPRHYQARPGPALAKPRGPARVAPEVLGEVSVVQAARDLGWTLRPDPALTGMVLVAGRTNAAGAGSSEPVVAPARPEGYALRVEAGAVQVRGRDAAGLRWGLRTLLQLHQAGPLEPCAIADWPEFAMRVHHDDVSRKQISTVADFRRILGWLGRFKVSHYTPYLEDVLHLASHPLIGEGRGKLQPGEIREVLEEAQRQGVEVFPTYTLLGHYENILSLPDYRSLAAPVFHAPSSLDPRRPETRAFLAQVLDEVCALFPSRWFHMGFDETQGVDREIFFAHANWCAAQLVARGKTPLMWVDMLYNHFGTESVRDLHPAIVPVVWGYGVERFGQEHGRYLAEMTRQRPTFGLAGYNSWCKFLPDQAYPWRNLRAWAEALQAVEAPAFMTSLWGDDGYENHRDHAWHLYAAAAEFAWRGSEARESDLAERFQTVFYGRPLPGLLRLQGEMPDAFRLPPRRVWNLFRQPHSALVRLRRQDPALGRQAAADLVRVEAARRDLARDRRRAVREVEHLDHWEVGLQRTALLLRRLAAAGSVRLSPARRATLRREVAATRQAYLEAWLRHNRPENVEVSLAVFDALAAELADPPSAPRPAPAPAPFASAFVPLDLSRHQRAFQEGVAGVPIGESVLAGVPFHCAGPDHTHWELPGGGDPVTLRLPAILAVRDLHLLATAPRPPDGQPAPALRLELLRQGRVVFREDLSGVRHLCDWFAPLGNHMWAGGGLAHVDPRRVDLVWNCHFFGVTRVRRFPLVGAPRADALRLTPMADRPVQVFALTVEALAPTRAGA